MLMLTVVCLGLSIVTLKSHVDILQANSQNKSISDTPIKPSGSVQPQSKQLRRLFLYTLGAATSRQVSFPLPHTELPGLTERNRARLDPLTLGCAIQTSLIQQGKGTQQGMALSCRQVSAHGC